MVRKAIVLAAGFGTRLRPLTLSRPKPLLPVMGEPMLARILDMLVSWGVEEIAGRIEQANHGRLRAEVGRRAGRAVGGRRNARACYANNVIKSKRRSL